MAEQWRRISVLDDGVDISPSRHLLADDIPLLLLHGAYQARYLREIPYIAASFSANRWRSNRLPGSLSHNFFFFQIICRLYYIPHNAARAYRSDGRLQSPG